MATTISCDVDDRVMVEAVGSLASSGIKAANRRAVLKTARLGARELKARTALAMFDRPGGYDPFSPRNFRVPKVRSDGASVSAGTGYTRDGYADRFRSQGVAGGGTRPRFRRNGASTGIEIGLGMVPGTAHDVDPLFPAIAEVEMVAELKKRDL